MPAEPGAPDGAQEWLRSLTRWPENVTAWLAADGKPRRPTMARSSPRCARPSARPSGRTTCSAPFDGVLDDRAHRWPGKGSGSMGGDRPGGLALVRRRPGRRGSPVPELIPQGGHGDRVTSVLVAADNASVITSSMDSTVRVWKLGDRQPAMVRILTDPSVGVTALALDPDGRLLLAGDGSGQVIGWDMAEDRPRPIFGPRGHDDGVVELRFLPEGPRFVSLDRLGRSVLWDGSAGAIRRLGAFAEDAIARLAAASRPEPGAPSLVAAIEDAHGKADSLRSYDARGVATGRFDGPGGRISALDLSSDGRRLVVGNDQGRVMVLELRGRAVAFDRTYSGPIRVARFSKAGPVAIADDRSLRLVEARAGGADSELLDPRGVAAPGRVDRVEFSTDGRWLAACTPTGGKALAWRLDDPAKPLAVAIPEDGSMGLAPAFSPDGRLLLMGDVDGGLRAWSLDVGPAGPKAEPRARVRPARGKVATLSPSATGRFLLEITKDDLGLVWDLEQGRGCKPLPGRWTSGAFLPDDSKLILSRRGDEGGDVVAFDRAGDTPMAAAFGRPVDADGSPLVASFERVVVSKSGKWVAAASNPGQLPLACVWEAATGALVHSARIHDGGLSAVDFSADEKFLLTASADGTAKLWPLEDPAVELRRAEVTFFSPDAEAPAFTAARVCPDDRRRVAAGSRGGLVALWSWEKGKGRPTRLGDPFRLNGEVNALAFSTDGKWLAASAMLDKAIRFWDVSGDGRPRPVDFRPRLAHSEQVGALAGWPGASMIVSGGDDAAVRFWDLRDRSLIGTLIAQARDARLVDWLAFTPGGLFDGSLPGEAMVKWRVGTKVVTLEQSLDTHHVFQLAGAFARGEKPREPELKAEVPALKIFDPPADRKVEAREVELTVWSGDPSPGGLRLYQNGVPIRAEGDFQPGETPHFARTKVQLRKGENRLYAMASKPGSADGKSDEVVLRYDGPEPAGRLHTLALGISDYEKRALKYAHVDALGIADFLRRQGVQGADRPGERIVLVDQDVNMDKIEDAFRRLRDATRGRPEDTVVLFLAGHTDTDEAANQFCLLLPRFPFEGNPPAVAAVAVRGNAGAGGARAKVGDPNVLPYSVLYNRLAQLGVLQRPGDRRRLPGRGDPRRPGGREHPEVRRAGVAGGPELLPPGRPPGRARQRGRRPPARPPDLHPAPRDGSRRTEADPGGPRRVPRAPLGRPRPRRIRLVGRARRLRRRHAPEARRDVPPGRPPRRRAAPRRGTTSGGSPAGPGTEAPGPVGRGVVPARRPPSTPLSDLGQNAILTDSMRQACIGRILPIRHHPTELRKHLDPYRKDPSRRNYPNHNDLRPSSWPATLAISPMALALQNTPSGQRKSSPGRRR